MGQGTELRMPETGPGSGLAVGAQANESPLWVLDPSGRREGVISEDEDTEC